MGVQLPRNHPSCSKSLLTTSFLHRVAVRLLALKLQAKRNISLSLCRAPVQLSRPFLYLLLFPGTQMLLAELEWA